MRRKGGIRVLCVCIVSAMLVSNTGVLAAGEAGETRIAVYKGEQVTVTVNGEQVILPDGQIISLRDCQILTEPEQTPVLETVPETAPPKEGGAGEAEVPKADEVAGTESPKEDEAAGTESPKEDEAAGTESPKEDEAAGTESPKEDEAAGTESPEEDGAGEADTSGGTIAVPVPSETPDVFRSEEDADRTPAFNVAAPALKAGIGFYVDELEAVYHLRFADDFAEMLTEIEREYAAAVFAEVKPEETQPDELKATVKNWQDVLAVYLLEQSRAGVAEFRLGDSAKGRLVELLGEMNTPTVTADAIVCEPQYIDDYIERNREALTESEAAFLNKYSSSGFSLLCAAATGAEGFILESLGGDISAERAQVVAAGYSLVGRIPYFWGGKSSVVGWDERWGSPMEVTASGISSSGTIQNYGLDCSGFVTWSFVNGYENAAAASLIGHGTAAQWAMSEEIKEEEALPGDLVFLQQPGAAGINHVGIVVGRNDDGSLVAVHCNAGKNGVTVDSAYQAGFRYVRRPLAYTQDETETLTGTQVRLLELKEKIAKENAEM